MTEKELRELDAFCAEHVMGLDLCNREPAILNPNEFVLSIPSKIVRARIGKNPTINFQPTTDPAAAMEVLKRCINFEHPEPPTKRTVCQCFQHLSGNSIGFNVYNAGGDYIKTTCIAETLELAICLLAKKLFSK